jgi:hypothetical protein
MTPTEKILWQELRANKLGVHFSPSILRTPPPNATNPSRIWGRKVGADFYCHKAALVIEVDGDIHDLQQEEDAPPPTSAPPPNSTNLEFGGCWVGAERDGTEDLC